MNKPLNVVILAAGKGTRMYSSRPKVLHELAGKALLKHVLDTARQLVPHKAIIVYGHGGEGVQEALREEEVTWVKQEPQLGTGHALLQALPHLEPDSVTLVLYGDVPLIQSETLRSLVAFAEDDHLGILTVRLDQPAGYGRILRDRAGRVQGIVEHKDASREELAIDEVNTGILACPTTHLSKWLPALRNENSQQEYYLTDIVKLACEAGIPISTTAPRDLSETLGVNTKQQLAELERAYQRARARQLMAAGVTLLDPERIDIRGRLECGADVTIDINCVFEGEVTLGDGVRVGAHSVLRNVNIGRDTRIEAFSLLEQADVGTGCRIGPYARVRPGTVLADDVHIGNFVEIKNSGIAQGSKVNHLSYVGDATVGRSVNIGAGTITCNYDGANKHRTVIGDHAFIGSDTQLVAPVTVGAGATIGAGSTVTRDAPAGELTLSRAKQVTINGWKRPVKRK